MNVEEVSRGLTLGEDGIWAPRTSEPVSYPSDGNLLCFLLEDRSFWFQHRNDCIAASLRSFPPSGPILDVGGGNGFVTRRLLDEGLEAVLLEPGSDGARNGKVRRGLPTVIRSTLAEALLDDASVGAAGVFDVLEHVEDDQDFVAGLSAALVKGGMLYGTVPAHPCLWSASDISAGHFRRYGESSLRELLSPHFDVVYLTQFFGALLLPTLLIRALPFKLGLGRGSVLGPEAEHGLDRRTAAAIARRLLAAEVGSIRRARRMRLGTSFLFVARRRPDLSAGRLRIGP